MKAIKLFDILLIIFAWSFVYWTVKPAFLILERGSEKDYAFLFIIIVTGGAIITFVLDVLLRLHKSKKKDDMDL